LRPAIQIETAVWPLRRPSLELPVILFVAEALRRPPEIASIACVSIVETAADKFVGLTRRAGAELAGLDEPDPTLVRHLHDLHALRAHYDTAEVIALAREVMLADAEAYGNQFPAYRENSVRETLRAVEGLAANPAYALRYGEFQRLMVYGDGGEYTARLTLSESYRSSSLLSGGYCAVDCRNAADIHERQNVLISQPVRQEGLYNALLFGCEPAFQFSYAHGEGSSCLVSYGSRKYEEYVSADVNSDALQSGGDRARSIASGIWLEGSGKAQSAWRVSQGAALVGQQVSAIKCIAD
jgi:hypothetical protein